MRWMVMQSCMPSVHHQPLRISLDLLFWQRA